MKPDVLLDCPNKSTRRLPYYSAIVIHHISLGMDAEPKDKEESEKIWRTCSDFLMNPANLCSANYIIGRFGELVQLVDPNAFISWHAGQSRWFDSVSRKWREQVNNFSIGIELVGDGNKWPFTDLQYDKLAEVIKSLCADFKIPKSNLTGHEMIAVPYGRKIDPGKNFDWERIFRLVLL
jgi:N-acetyl-anhydromuramyl-L-alanine amidase AmpD